jgi:aminoglycoside phosphotransferase (APT) family kinase protein
VVSAQGVPAPRVVACEPSKAVLGRAFMVMEYLPGHPQLIIAFPRLLIEVPRFFTLPRRHAKALNMVHSLDAEPLRQAFAAEGINAAPDHWFDFAQRIIDAWGFEGLRPGLEWLRSHQPDEPPRPSICHGDLFGANILERRGEITAILDWVAVTIADPAFDLGGQLAAYEMSATPGPYVFQLLSIAFGRLLAWGLRVAYRKYRRFPRETVRYYSAMRAFTEMTFKLGLIAESRTTGVKRRMPTWRPTQCARYFRRRTGIPLKLPR